VVPAEETSTLIPTMSLANLPVLFAALPVADRMVVSPLGSVSANTLLVEALMNVDSRWFAVTSAVLLLQQLLSWTSVVAAWAMGGPRRKPASAPAATSAMPFQYLRARIDPILSSRPRSGLQYLPLLLRRKFFFTALIAAQPRGRHEAVELTKRCRGRERVTAAAAHRLIAFRQATIPPARDSRGARRCPQKVGHHSRRARTP